MTKPDPDDLLDDDYRGRTRDRSRRPDRQRTRLKRGKSLPPNALRGQIIQPLGPSWLVLLEGGDYIAATVSGTVDAPDSHTIVAVGDYVYVDRRPKAEDQGPKAEDQGPKTDDQEPGTRNLELGTIVKIDDRTTVLSRKAAGRQQREQVVVANVDQLAIVMSFRDPVLNKRLVDRYLIAADKGDLQPLLIVNKMDLVDADSGDPSFKEIREDLAAYWDDLKIPVFLVSAITDHEDSPSTEPTYDWVALRRAVRTKRTLLAGPSGVGKSSIINSLSNASQVVGEISAMYLKGKHTTTAARFIPLEGGGGLVDSPGIREFAIWELDLEELPFYFEEFEQFMHECKFTPCTHTHEPHCAVKDALEEGRIDPERYFSYLALRDELEVG
jgi:ribosome small subunit-dependent GTPase A